ncbi:MAG: tRNA (adenosine(37)-N6)-threonylcarbamoyltransferase complex dimerization subunit type 1 TsaB [Candidatus Marinimicrobia bacterium]|nr:tRNA (adenosine(37)-N6)-threonylcarbamoyltransferase complex dimerization subunit type 1 TsaB [Candidatus Neomarinimicrobiota bacterium]
METATNICSISLFLDGEFVETKDSSEPRSHAIKLPVFTDEILKEYKCKVSDLDGIAISAGPGSYTGLRIGMSLAKGLALSCDIPLLPVKTLFAMDMNIVEASPHWVCIHSHKNMVFAQKFHNHESISEPQCISVDDLDIAPIFGTELQKNNIEVEFTEILPSSKNIGRFALKNSAELAEKALKKVSPFYLTEFNINK